MRQVPIKLKNKDDVEQFVEICSSCSFDIDIIQGRTVVDAKSLLGVLTLDLSKDTYVVAHDEDSMEFYDKISTFARGEK